MTSETGVTIVVPAFNEREGLASVLPQLQEVEAELPGPLEIVVVDDASTDGSAEVAREAGARVVRHERNLGYGAALKSGIAAAVHETIVIIDADGTYPAEAIPVLVAALESVDMVVGDRISTRGHVPLVRRPAKWFLRRLACFVTGAEIPDLNSGLRAFRRSLVWQYLPVISDRFSFTTTLTIAALCDGLSVDYVDIDYRLRIGRSKIVARDFLGFLSLVTRLSILFRPLKVFSPVALSCLMLGAGKLVFDIFLAVETHGPGIWFRKETVSTTAVILLLVAVQTMLMGMLAESVAVRQSTRGPSDYVPARLRALGPPKSPPVAPGE